MKQKYLVIFYVCILVAAILPTAYYLGFRKTTVEKAGPPQTAEGTKTAPASQQSVAPGSAGEQANAAKVLPGEADAPVVEIPVDKQQLIGVRTVKAAVRPMSRVIRTVGRVEYDEKKLTTVNTKFEGWIEKLYVDYAGRYVKKGEPVAEIYSPELQATQHEYLNALRWANRGKEVKDEQTAAMLARDAQAILEAARDRLAFADITDEQIREIEKVGKPIRTLTLYSPVSGVVIQKTAVQGTRLMPGEKLLDVADLSTVWIAADIYEYELPFVKVGQAARISLSYFPGKEFSSRVDYIYPVLAGETRTAKARFTVPNPGGELKPQMFTNVEIKINLGSRLVVPTEAVIDTGVRKIVYVDKGEGNFEPREVVSGLRTEDMIEITRGLRAGEKVASSANFLIDSEAQLRGVSPLPMKNK